jgi:AraC-like DNA-binding protein
MSYFNYLIANELQMILDHFSALTHVRMAFFSLDGEEIRVGQEQKQLSPFCHTLRNEFGLETLCLKLDAQKRQEALTSGDILKYECHAGLNEAIMPVVFLDHTIGFIMIGQYRTRSQMNVELTSDLSKDECDRLNRAFLERPFFTPERQAHLLGLFKEIVQGIMSRDLVRTRVNDVIANVVAYLYHNIDRNITITEAAAYVNKSPSRIRHLFSSELGKSFKQFQIDIKLIRAEALLKSNSNITVQKAAQSVGYDDPLYFSRLYKKYRGVSPSKARCL